ncbi:MAG: HAD family hydrolase [Acidimicrobiales bacterium]
MVGSAVGAVLLDVGGVFMLPDHDVLREPLRAAGACPDAATLDRAHYAGVAAMDQADQVDWSLYHRAMAREAGVPAAKIDEATKALGDAFLTPGLWRRVVPGSIEALRHLAETGVNLGVVSNSDGTVEEGLLAAKVCQVGAGEGVPVTVVLDSHVLGMDKPDPRLFWIALERLGVPPERAVHVGDTVRTDVHGARAAGVRALHLDPYGQCRVDPDGHEHVGSLAEVARRVGLAG